MVSPFSLLDISDCMKVFETHRWIDATSNFSIFRQKFSVADYLNLHSSKVM